jgi:hypothetical protein
MNPPSIDQLDRPGTALTGRYTVERELGRGQALLRKMNLE